MIDYASQTRKTQLTDENTIVRMDSIRLIWAVVRAEHRHDRRIAIDGTTIAYPVMQTPGRPNYYLNHSFEEKRSNCGVLYATENAMIDPQSDNITMRF